MYTNSFSFCFSMFAGDLWVSLGTHAIYLMNILGRIAYDVVDVLREICIDYSY